MATLVFDSVEELIKTVKPKTVKLGTTKDEKMAKTSSPKLDKHQAIVVLEQIESQLSQMSPPNPELFANKLKKVLNDSDWTAYISGNFKICTDASLKRLKKKQLVTSNDAFIACVEREDEDYIEAQSYWLQKINIEIPTNNSRRVGKYSVSMLFLPKILKHWGISFTLDNI